jgi:hypothetical protein
MSYRTVHEPEFRERIRTMLDGVQAGAVTGPGRSGAVASVYASHILGVPFIPYRQKVPDKLRPVLVIDTAKWTGATIRKAKRLYGDDAQMLTVYDEPPMVRFWYEARASL